MEKYGSMDYAKTKAEEYAFEAKKLFKKIFLKVPTAHSTLEELIDFMVQREW